MKKLLALVTLSLFSVMACSAIDLTLKKNPTTDEHIRVTVTVTTDGDYLALNYEITDERLVLPVKDGDDVLIEATCTYYGEISGVGTPHRGTKTITNITKDATYLIGVEDNKVTFDRQLGGS